MKPQKVCKKAYSNKELGNIGEGIVANLLIKKGHVILDRNYTKACGELDVISIFNGILHINEVKTVLHSSFTNYRPEELINNVKIGRIIKTTFLYLAERGANSINSWQLDAHFVYLRLGNGLQVIGGRVKHIPNIVGDSY